MATQVLPIAASTGLRHRPGHLHPAVLRGGPMIILSGIGLLLVGSAVWHEIQVWRGKR